ncbi:hypothetical protein Cpa01nite_04960 [Cellulomonas pakistanensis]|uniref:Uncharacterized protein n=1 Tax=Cellulomonas pakistanensis TaxID=992287 RepID=A0A919P6E4_9CELL|nr:hypothetical protein Cpa01nite_04960 [Cellulomonas pakistanensis]
MRRVLAQDTHDRGLAMPLVIGITAALAALMVAGVAFATGALRNARSDQDWNSALAAAYAGIEEFESRLAYDTSYYSAGNPAASFSAGSNVRLPVGDATNPAFGLGATGTWATVPGSNGASQFRYEIDNSRFAQDGTLRVRSTGRAGGETRSIVADLKQEGFIDFLYFTDFEVTDPQAVDPTDTKNCAIKYPNPRPCDNIYFGGMDQLNGPVHTNDAIQTNGPAEFNGRVTTSWEAASGPNYIRYEGARPTFQNPGDPTFSTSIGMPPTNTALKKETRSDRPDEVAETGCLYTGPTSIEFKSDGTMRVISPWTQFTNTTGDTDTGGSAPDKCGKPGSTGLAKKSGSTYVGVDVPVTDNLVIYVQNVPTTSGNVNRVASSSRTPVHPGAIACTSSNRNNIGYPIENETVPFSTAYGCRNGDVFVKGVLNGRTTVAAENYVYITGNVTYADDNDDMLGLVGNNAVWVWNPMRTTTDWRGDTIYSSLLGGRDRYIDAAILSVAHTFMVQNYNRGGTRGDLWVTGAIAQKFRGPVATTTRSGSVSTLSTGYAKKYYYDERFRTQAPPKYLSPVTTTYGITVWVEVEPAFDSDGNYR